MAGNDELDREDDKTPDVDDVDLDELFENDEDGDEEVVGDDETEKPETDESKDDDTKDESDDKDEEAGEDESESEPPADGDDDRKMVPIAALHDERRKARALKEENERLRKEKGHSEDELGIGPEPDRFENPEEHDAWLLAKHDAEQQLERDAKYKESVDDSRAAAMEKYEDYEEKESIFLMLANRDPKLREEMIDSKDPAAYAYKAASKWEADRDAKLIEKLKAEGKLKDEQDKKPDDAGTKSTKKKRPSLVNAAGAGTVADDSDFDPDDLDSLVGDPGY